MTRRPGGSSVSVYRVRRRQARHKPSGLEGAVPIARGTSKPGLTGSRLPMAAAVSKGLIDVDLPEEAFQRGAPCGAASPHVPGPVDDVTNRVSGCPPVPVPSALSCAGFSANLGAFNPRSYIIDDIGDSFGGPTPNYEPGASGNTQGLSRGRR